MNNSKPTYRIRFFFEYGSGACLWSANKPAIDKYGVGALDADNFDLKGNIIRPAPIALPQYIKQKIYELDILYMASLDAQNPGGDSIWSWAQWDYFFMQAKSLHEEISLLLGSDFEVLYQQK